ncbi:MAG TPA: methylenetetrahydrofolate reductase C-terminal domain-containing protein [Anaerolineae bacterium]|nr:methylenetetrahydrofolate reductase C-terminal domain-containing protein [Anaerolineae bacterium]HMR66695.1 methylenetetrahydrofolate reductase C-terminal domain-containing protein [Anaerolineae bacterium]
MSYLKEGRRAPGSEWLKERPRLLERLYDWTVKLFNAVYPAAKRVSPRLAERVMIPLEEVSKGYLFNCQMCGQCILHSTGMTCPMTCPKNLRNGPCGGVRANGHCEVIPELPCVWVQAWERSSRMAEYGHEIKLIQPPVNRTLQYSSSWINLAEGLDRQTPPGWQLAEQA